MHNRYRKIVLCAAALVVSGALSLTGCGSSAGADSASDADIENAEPLDEEDLDGGDEDLEEFDTEEIEFDDEDDSLEEDEVPETEEEKALNEYLDKNTIDELLKRHDSFSYTEGLYMADGTELYSYLMYCDADLRYSEYNDGYKEIITSDRYDGFDSEQNVPVRYVFYDEEMRQEQIDSYNDIVFLWAGETVETKSEKDGQVVFDSYIRDPEYIEMSLYDEDLTAEEGDALHRVTIFDQESGDVISSIVTYEPKSGEESVICDDRFTMEAEKVEPDADLLAKLDSSDSHKLTLTLDVGTEDEVVITSEVGKGCAFYPVIYDGYTFFTDKECTQEIEEEEAFAETEKDMTLYGTYIEGDEFDGDELVLDADDLGLTDEEVTLEGDEISDEDLGDADESGVVG